MTKGVTASEKKALYFEKVHELLRTYTKICLVNVDNVTSSQLHQIRSAMRGKAVLLMGKNTLIRKAMRQVIEELPQFEILLPYIVGNVGLVFTNGDVKEMCDLITKNKVAAPAKIGAIAQSDVTVPAQNTGIEPGKTNFFQALSIATKVVKGAIEILNDVLLITAGNKVTASQAELLSMLKITPFTYGLTVVDIYDDGSIYNPSVLNITADVITARMLSGIKNVAALSLELEFTTLASVPHLMVNGYKRVLSIAMSTEFSFPAAEAVKELLANPSAFAAAAPAAESKKVEKVVEEVPSEESDGEMGMGLFD